MILLIMHTFLVSYFSIIAVIMIPAAFWLLLLCPMPNHHPVPHFLRRLATMTIKLVLSPASESIPPPQFHTTCCNCHVKMDEGWLPWCHSEMQSAWSDSAFFLSWLGGCLRCWCLGFESATPLNIFHFLCLKCFVYHFPHSKHTQHFTQRRPESDNPPGGNSLFDINFRYI